MNNGDRRERQFAWAILIALITITLFTSIVFYSVYATPHMSVGPINVDNDGVPAEQH